MADSLNPSEALALRSTRDQTLDLSRSIGDASRGLAILGEGNVSGRVDQRSFWIKASGGHLRTLDESMLVQL